MIVTEGTILVYIPRKIEQKLNTKDGVVLYTGTHFQKCLKKKTLI